MLAGSLDRASLGYTFPRYIVERLIKCTVHASECIIKGMSLCTRSTDIIQQSMNKAVNISATAAATGNTELGR